jgi:hypothetical protein
MNFLPKWALEARKRREEATNDWRVSVEFEGPCGYELERVYTIGPVHRETPRKDEHWQQACADRDFIAQFPQTQERFERALEIAIVALNAALIKVDWNSDEFHNSKQYNETRKIILDAFAQIHALAEQKEKSDE